MTGQRTRDNARLSDRVTAPLGRRACEVTGNRASGGYRIFSALDRSGPEPLAGQLDRVGIGFLQLCPQALAYGIANLDHSPNPKPGGDRQIGQWLEDITLAHSDLIIDNRVSVGLHVAGRFDHLRRRG